MIVVRAGSTRQVKAIGAKGGEGVVWKVPCLGLAAYLVTVGVVAECSRHHGMLACSLSRRLLPPHIIRHRAAMLHRAASSIKRIYKKKKKSITHSQHISLYVMA